jgi:hypothetical protein
MGDSERPGNGLSGAARLGSAHGVGARSNNCLWRQVSPMILNFRRGILRGGIDLEVLMMRHCSVQSQTLLAVFSGVVALTLSLGPVVAQQGRVVTVQQDRTPSNSLDQKPAHNGPVKGVVAPTPRCAPKSSAYVMSVPNGFGTLTERRGSSVRFRCRAAGECSADYSVSGNVGKLVGQLGQDCRFKGHWILARGSSRCAETKAGSAYWGRLEFQFNASGRRWHGRYGICNRTLKYKWNGRLR